MFYRADGIHRASPRDANTLVDMGVATVIDLRSNLEIKRHGRFPIEQHGGRFEHRPLLEQLWTRDMLERTPHPVEFLVERYQELAEDRPEVVVSIFDTFAAAATAVEPRRAVLFHCAAGKDRTGVTAALLLAAVEVDDSNIAADYAATSDNMPAIIDWVRRSSKRGLETMADQPRAFLDCPPAAILGLLEYLRRQHGSVSAYLEAMGVSPSTIARLRRGFVADEGEATSDAPPSDGALTPT